MNCDHIVSLAPHYGLEDVYHCENNRLLLLESARPIDHEGHRVVLLIWYEHNVVSVILPHPRLRRIQSFYFDVDVHRLREIFANPQLNKEIHYIGGDWITQSSADIESVTSALRRQIAHVDFELSYLKNERNILQNRMAQLEGQAKSQGIPSSTENLSFNNPSATLKSELGGMTASTTVCPNAHGSLDALCSTTNDAEYCSASETMNKYDSIGRKQGSKAADPSDHIDLNHQKTRRAHTDHNMQSSEMSSRQQHVTDNHNISPRSSPSELEPLRAGRKIPSYAMGQQHEERRLSADSSQMKSNYRQGQEKQGMNEIKSAEIYKHEADLGVKSSIPKSSNLGNQNFHRDSQPERYKGNRCLYSFSNEEYQEEFGKSWSVKPVNCVALGQGYIIVYEDGGLSWWDAPLSLDRKFRDEAVRLPAVQYVTLGPDGNYFIKFINGKMEWIAKASFQRAVKVGATEKCLSIDKVALGANGSWIILWTDGSVVFEGVPKDLALQLSTLDQGPGLRDISLGPHGEWFAIFKDHSVQANNLPSPLHTALGKIKQSGGRVRNVVFGQSKSWYVRYWDGIV